MTNTYKLIKSFLLYIMTAFGISLCITASLGVSSVNSMNLSIAGIFDLKIGTITIFINSLFLIIYILLTRFAHVSKYIIQFAAVLSLGLLINIFIDFLAGFPQLPYLGRVLMLASGTIISGISVGGIIHYNMITFPIESVCVRLSEISSFSFMKLRYLIDVLAASISISISLVTPLPFYIREGTFINMLLLSYAMNWSKNLYASGKIQYFTKAVESAIRVSAFRQESDKGR